MKFIKKLGFTYLLAVLALGLVFGSSAFADEVDDVPPPVEETQDGPDSVLPEGEEVEEGPQYVSGPEFLTAGWDRVDSDYYYLNNPWWVTKSTEGNIVKSTGGDFKIVIPAHSWSSKTGTYAQMQIQLMEDDGAYGDDPVKTWMIYPRSYAQNLTITNAGSFVDGGNGAEFYVKYTANYYGSPSKIFVNYYD